MVSANQLQTQTKHSTNSKFSVVHKDAIQNMIIFNLGNYVGFVGGSLLDALLAVMGHFSPGLLGHGSNSALLQVECCGGVGKRAMRPHIMSDKTGNKHQ